MPYSYETAFQRNIGVLTSEEQERLRHKKIAIAGLGGVGGIHLLTLVRLGCEEFHLAEFDHYELHNFNRQVGATIDTINRPKLDVMIEMARVINPAIHIRRFEEGITSLNVTEFLDGADLYIDGIDFFAMDARRLVFAACAGSGIPAITAAPIGMGAAYLTYLPGGMTFEQYFGMEGLQENHQFVNFIVGLSPRMLHLDYAMDERRIDIIGRSGPSTMIGCNLCAGVAAAEALKILLRRGKVYPMPYFQIFDSYLNRFVRGSMPGGAKNPLFKLKTWIGHRKMDGMVKARMSEPPLPPALPDTPMYRILDKARWAPSGDNMQPWRFRIVSGQEASVEYSTRDLSVYEYRNGEPVHLSIGMMLEALRLAALQEGMRSEWKYESLGADEHRIAVRLSAEDRLAADPLASFIEHRSVNRHGYCKEALTPAETARLEQSLNGMLMLRWHDTPAQKAEFAALNALATDIRLRMAATYTVHRDILDWQRCFSSDKVPVTTLPMPRPLRKIMRFALASSKRNAFMNNWFGTKPVQGFLDIKPGKACAAHFTLAAARPLQGDIPATLVAGGAVMRFWLTATSLGIALQPSVATLIFAHYGKEKSPVLETASLTAKAQKLAEGLATFSPVGNTVFSGRVGYPLSAKIISRSVRKPLAELIIPGVLPVGTAQGGS